VAVKSEENLYNQPTTRRLDSV